MSLLLDALRQAEKNKNAKSFDTFNKSKNQDQDLIAPEPPSTGSIELSLLPEFEESTLLVEQEQNKAEVKDIHQPTKQKTDEVELNTPNLEEFSIITENVSSKLIEQENTFSSDKKEDAPETSKPKNNKKNEKNNPDKIIPPVIEQAPLNQVSIKPKKTDTLKTQAVEKETELHSPEAAKNILEVSSPSKIKSIYWVIGFLIITVITAAIYLYSLMTPSPYISKQSSQINNQLIEDSTWNLDETMDEVSALSSGEAINTSTPGMPQITQTPPASVVIPPENHPSSIKSIRKPNKKIIASAHSSFSNFTIEPEDNTVDYPHDIKITIKRQHSSERIQLNKAYNAYQQKNYPSAKHLYTRILQKNHSNINALNAMGDMAIKTGNSQRARVFFEKVLQYDGNQIFAKQALIRLNKSQSPLAQESLYKSLIDSYPNDSQSHATLANFYLSQQRWLEAQTSYFKAVELNPDNPDYRYNLAISLDHLAKPDIALRYYKKSLELSKIHHAMLDILALEKRIQQLQAR